MLAVELPDVRFEVCCSGGTYIRTLCADIGRDLGCGGHLSALTRTACCGFTLDSALTLERLADLGPERAAAAIMPMADALPDMPAVMAGPELVAKVRTGRTLTPDDVAAAGRAAPGAYLKILDSAGALAAVVQVGSDRPEVDYCCVFQPSAG